MIMEASGLRQDGTTEAELSGIIKEIEKLSEEDALSMEQREELQGECEEARASVERTYQGDQVEGGRMDETETWVEWIAD